MSGGTDLQSVLSTLGHDLRGPLFTAQGFLQLVLAKTEGKPHDHAKLALASVEEAARMVNGVLQWARTEPAQLEKAELDLHETVQGALADLEALRRQRKVRVDVGDLPEVRGDPRSIRYALQHLLDNAIRHGRPEGTVRVRGGTGAEGWWVEVSDEGPGISGDVDQYRVPFWQAAGRASGTGIALAHRVAENHQGHLDIRSGTDGTTVRFAGAT